MIRWSLALLTAPWLLGAPPAPPVSSAHPPAASAPAVDARSILDKIDGLYRGASSKGEFGVTIVTARSTRQLHLLQWSKGSDKFLVRVTAPDKEKGNATLKSGANIWNYLPKVDRTVKLAPSMMSGSWMGSHVTNDDLVRQSRFATDYDAVKTFEGTRDGQAVVELSLKPKPNAKVVWGKVLVLARSADQLPLTLRYFDEAGQLVQTMSFSDVRSIGGRTIPARFRVQPNDKPGEYTDVHYESLTFNEAIADDFFSLRTLQKP